MRPIIKRSMQAFWNIKDWSKRSAPAHFEEVFTRDSLHYWCSTVCSIPENKGDSRKLKKVQELVQHFCEQCRHYVPKQDLTKNVDKLLR